MKDKRLVSIKLGKDIRRVPKDEAESFINKGWHYTSKTAWRQSRKGGAK